MLKKRASKSKKIRVLFIEQNQDGTTGGSHYCLLDLLKLIDKKSFKPIAMFYENNKLIDDFKSTGVDVVIFAKPVGINIIKWLNNKVTWSIPGLFLLPKIFQVCHNVVTSKLLPIIYLVYYILRYKVDVVYNNNSAVYLGLELLLAAKLTGRKCIAHERGYYKTILWYNRFHPKYWDYIIGISESTKINLESLGVDTSNYSTVYDRINIDEFRSRVAKNPQEIRDEFRISAEQPLIGIVGNLKRWKGQIIVVEAVNFLKPKYDNMKCLLIGDVSSNLKDDIDFLREVKRKIRNYNLQDNIILTGFRSDVPNIVNTLDLFIHSSISPEPFGIVVLEAMALGKAVIASNEGGPVEIIVNGQSGLLIEVNNPKILAEKIDLLLSDEMLRKEIGKNAITRVRNKFSRLDIKHIESIIQSLTKHS